MMDKVQRGIEKEAAYQKRQKEGGKPVLTQGKRRAKTLTVHLVPHTRVRLGWKKTLD